MFSSFLFELFSHSSLRAMEIPVLFVSTIKNIYCAAKDLGIDFHSRYSTVQAYIGSSADKSVARELS